MAITSEDGAADGAGHVEATGEAFYLFWVGIYPVTSMTIMSEINHVKAEKSIYLTAHFYMMHIIGRKYM